MRVATVATKHPASKPQGHSPVPVEHWPQNPAVKAECHSFLRAIRQLDYWSCQPNSQNQIRNLPRTPWRLNHISSPTFIKKNNSAFCLRVQVSATPAVALYMCTNSDKKMWQAHTCSKAKWIRQIWTPGCLFLVPVHAVCWGAGERGCYNEKEPHPWKLWIGLTRESGSVEDCLEIILGPKLTSQLLQLRINQLHQCCVLSNNQFVIAKKKWWILKRHRVCCWSVMLQRVIKDQAASKPWALWKWTVPAPFGQNLLVLSNACFCGYRFESHKKTVFQSLLHANAVMFIALVRSNYLASCSEGTILAWSRILVLPQPSGNASRIPAWIVRCCCIIFGLSWIILDWWLFKDLRMPTLISS